MDNQKEIEFIKNFFGSKVDKSGLLQWQHGVNTSNILEVFINKYNEVPANIKNDLLLGALGHDLLEDTSASAADITHRWGGEVLRYINGMTNTQGDNSFDEYIKHLKDASEEVLLIKLADILANTKNSIENTAALPPEWLSIFWIPLLDRYDKALLNKTFQKYPFTLNAMAQEIKCNIERIKKSES